MILVLVSSDIFGLCWSSGLFHLKLSFLMLIEGTNSTISWLLQVDIVCSLVCICILYLYLYPLLFVFPLSILFLFDICWSINWTFSALTSIYWTGKEIVVQLQQQTIPHSSVSLFYLEQIQGCNHHCKFSQFFFEAKLH